MARLLLLCIAGFCFGLGGAARAQLSSFPVPPSLPARNVEGASHSAGYTNSPSTFHDGTGFSSVVTATNPALAPATPAAPETFPITAATLSSMDALDDKVKLESGDRVSFRVMEDRDEAVSRMVTDTGEIDFPYIGRVQVNGETCRGAALQVKKLYEIDYYYRATVILGLDVINSRSVSARDTAWIVGQVRQVGPQEMLPNQSLTVSQVILRAGGFGDFADQRKVRLVHRGGSASVAVAAGTEDNFQDGQIVDVKAIFQGKSTSDPVVKPNDLIIVPKRLVNF
jgi:polysaccharide export outer membrane protein